jgi:hypothetical protein
VTFETLVWIPPAFALGLLGVAVLLGLRRNPNNGGESENMSAVKFARTLTLIACIAACYLTLATATSDPPPASILALFFLILGPIAGTTALVLFLWKARGPERVLASVAALLVSGNTLFFVWVTTRLW